MPQDLYGAKCILNWIKNQNLFFDIIGWLSSYVLSFQCDGNTLCKNELWSQFNEKDGNIVLMYWMFLTSLFLLLLLLTCLDRMFSRFIDLVSLTQYLVLVKSIEKYMTVYLLKKYTWVLNVVECIMPIFNWCAYCLLCRLRCVLLCIIFIINIMNC